MPANLVYFLTFGNLHDPGQFGVP